MSHLSKGVLGLIAASLALGGVQFGMASDNGLARAIRGDARLWQNEQVDGARVVAAINRSAKADRLLTPTSQSGMVTLAFQLPGLKDTLVAMRLPVSEAGRLRPSLATEVARDVARSGGRDVSKTSVRRKTTVACEPVVSVLTEVAKQLEPGRCIT